MEKYLITFGILMLFGGGVKASEIIGQISTDPNFKSTSQLVIVSEPGTTTPLSQVFGGNTTAINTSQNKSIISKQEVKPKTKFNNQTTPTNKEVLGVKLFSNNSLIRQIGDIKVYIIKDANKKHIHSLLEIRKYYFGWKVFNVDASEMLLYPSI